MKQVIRFCTAADGVRLAYATSGGGPPLVKAATYLTHLEHDWNGPVWRHWLEGLSRNFTLVRYDERGCGLSDWDVTDYSIDAWVQDLEAVVDAAGLEQFPLLGISQGAAVSVAYAAKHPERVTRLILYGGYARGRFTRAKNPDDVLAAETMINAIRLGWGRENAAFRQIFTTLLIPDGSVAQKAWLNELARISVTPENASAMERAFYNIDVTDQAGRVKSPTLVLHAPADAGIPFEEGLLLATLIPDARLIPLDSHNHILLEDEPAWPQFLAEVHSFLGVTAPTAMTAPDFPNIFSDLTPREMDVLTWLATGAGNEEIAQYLSLTPKSVRNYTSRIYDKLGVETRAQAIVMAREAGLEQTARPG